MTSPSGMPARPTWYVGRAGISTALTRGRWLTAIVAGAGAGKTTAVGGWAAARRAVWLPLRADDAELTVLLAGLGDAVSQAGGIGRIVTGSWHDVLAPAGTGTDDEYARADTLAAYVADLLDAVTVPEQMTIVLDGFERLPATSAAVRFVEALTRHTPGGIRLVVVSREPLPFAVDRLREMDRLTELAAVDLAFDVDETYQLLTIALGDAAAADEIAGDLHTLTAGWPGQVSLGAAWLAQQPSAARRDQLASFKGFDGQLAQTVLANADPHRRDLVRAAAYLPRVSARMLAEIGATEPATAGASRPPDVLGTCAPMLMPESGRPGWHRISTAARTAVRASDRLADDQRRDLLRRASTWFADNGELDAAITTATALGEPGVLTAILDAHGATLTVNGRSADVISAVAAIPEPCRTSAVWLVEGEAKHSRGDVAGALVCLTHVDSGGILPASMARRIGKIRQLAGDIAGAIDVYTRSTCDGREPVDEAIMLGQLATVHWLRGDLESARSVTAEAMAIAVTSNDPRALAGAYAVAAMVAESDGDHAANDEYARKAAESAERGGDLVQLTRIRVNRSQRLLQQGNFVTGLAELDRVLRLCELTGTVGWFGAVARTNRGWALRGLGRLDEAVADFETAAQMWRAAGSDLVAYAQIGLGSAYLERGDLEAAEVELTAATRTGERSGDHQALTGLSTLARVRYATDRTTAWDIADRAIDRDAGNWRNWALLTVGWLALCDGDLGRAAECGDDVFEHLARFPDASAEAEATELRALACEDVSLSLGLLADAKAQWVRLGNAVHVNRTAVLIARRTGSSSVVAEARLRAVGVRPSVARSAGPLRFVGAFRDALAEADGARFLAAARSARAKVADYGDMGRIRQMLADALALLPGGPATANPEARSEYLAVVGALAYVCELAGDVDAALGWHLRLLEDDPSNESGHLGVVTTLARAGRHAEARRRYRLYTEHMREGLREPAPYPASH